jgi:hypothetical protein
MNQKPGPVAAPEGTQARRQLVTVLQRVNVVCPDAQRAYGIRQDVRYAPDATLKMGRVSFRNTAIGSG